MRNLIQKPLLIVCLLCLAQSLEAQTNKLADESVIPPSPTSAVYHKNAGWAPDLATGAATLSLPLYEVQVGGWSLPFSLQYYSTGIKVHATPYPAGLGWTLLPGLRVTRTIRGRADLWYERDIRKGGSASFDYEKLTVYDAVTGSQPGLFDWDMLDSQYDIFTVSLPEETCRFILVEENGIYHAETVNSLLKIDILGTNGAGFKVTDGKGVIYWFGDDTTTPGNNYTEYADNRYPTAWVLRKVQLPGTGNEITLTWDKGNGSGLGYGYWAGSHAIRDKKPSLYDNDPNPSFDDATVLGTLEGSYSYPTILMLKQVNFPGGTVVLSYESMSTPLLTSMTVSNFSGKTVKSVALSYGTGLQHRLLKTLYLSEDGKYSFSYYNENTGFANIYAQDWWGYYNGKPNTSLVPQISLRVYPGEFASGEYQTYGYADRSIDTTAMKTNTLQRIIYPGGGWTEFAYETNSFDGTAPTTPALGPASRITLTQGAGLRVHSITTFGGMGSIPIVRTYSYGPSGNGKGNVGLLPTPDTFIGEYYAYAMRLIGDPPTAHKGLNLRLVYLNTQSNYDGLQTYRPDVWYDTVTETLGDGSRTVYTFSRPVTEDVYVDNIICDFPARTIYECNTLFGPGCVLTSQKEYASAADGGALKREITHRYEVLHESSKDVEGLIVLRKELSMLSNGPDFLFLPNGTVASPEGILTEQPLFTYINAPTHIRFRYARRTSTQTKEYTSQGTITEKDSLHYKGPLVDARIMTDGQGIVRSQSWLYPDSWSLADSSQQTILQTMYSLNMQSCPFLTTITTTTPRLGSGGTSITTIDQVRTEYELFPGTNLYLPSRLLRIRNGVEAPIREYEYDARGNMISTVRDGYDKIAWLWSYNSMFPVMEISGLSYEEVRNRSTYNVDNLPLYTDTPSIRSMTNALRTTIGSSATTRSFTWEPLLGIIGETDARGWETTYQYDEEGRLSMIKGGDGNPLVRYGYHHIGDAVLSVDFSALSTYSYGSAPTFTATGSGGTGHMTYQWTLKNAYGTTVFSSPASENSSRSITMNQQGLMTLTCTKTDLLTGEASMAQHSFTVSSPTIEFANTSSMTGNASGYITTNEPLQISFFLYYSLGYGLSGSAMIAGTLYEFDGVDSQFVQTTVSDFASFHIGIIDSGGSGSSGEVSLTITNVPTGYSIGTPSTIIARY